MLQPKVVPMKDVVYVGGGLGNTCTLSTFIYAYSVVADTWKVLPETDAALFGMCVFKDSLVTIGGVCGDGVTGKVYRLDEAKQDWVEFLPAMPTGRFSLSIFSMDAILVACGGGTWGDEEDMPVPCSAVEVYRHESNSWLSAGILPRPSAAMSSTLTGSMCYLLGDGESEERHGPMSADIAEIASLKGTSDSLKDGSLWLNWCHLLPPPVANTSIVATSSYLLAVGGHSEDGTVTAAVHLYLNERREWWKLARGELPQGLEGCGLAMLDTTGKVMVVGGEDSAGYTDSVFIGNLL